MSKPGFPGTVAGMAFGRRTSGAVRDPLFGPLRRRLFGTVRRKMLWVVAACVVPSLLAAWFRAEEAYDDLISEVRTRMDLVDEAFAGDLEEDMSGARLALRMAASDPRLMQDLEIDDHADIRRLTAALAAGLGDEASLAVADDEGHLVAVSKGLRPGHAIPEATLAHLRSLLRDNQVRLVPVPDGAGSADGKPVYALAVSEPVRGEASQLGSLIMVKPLDSDFLDHAKKQLGSDWALTVNGRVVAKSDGNSAPALSVSQDAVVQLGKANGRLYALNSFRPALLQLPGQEARVTASQDVTDVRNEVRGDLGRSLGILGGVSLLAIGAALFIARSMVKAIGQIDRAARALKTGHYELAQEVKTGDELEALATAFNQAVLGLRERDQLKDTFGKYVTRHVAEQILLGKNVLGGETVPVTVFFADIRGFTSISEKMEPKALLDFLNLYFSGMVECVLRHGGVVDKFIGDAIMAVFGAPVPQPDDAERAVRAALDMRAKLVALNADFAQRGLPEIKIGIGVHSGTVVAGNMGHHERMEYTVIGDPVNLASRLESMTKELGVDVLLSEDTYQKVKERIVAEPLQRIRVRGRVQEVQVYRLDSLVPASTTEAA